MQRFIPTAPALALALAFPLVSTSVFADATAHAELKELRAQLQALQGAYEARIVALEQRLARSERAPAAATAAAAAPASISPASTSASAFNPEISMTLQGRYLSRKGDAGRAIGGFWPAAGHAHDGEQEGAGRRGFSLDHTELMLAANVDPFWRGQAIFAVMDGEVETEEAWFQSLGLGHGLTLKGGRLRSGIGYHNEQHAHQWAFADAPLAYTALFGSHGSYTQDGVQIKWVAPTPLFLELGAEAGRGAAFPGSDRNGNGMGAAALFAHVGGDLGWSSSWRAGLSWLTTRAEGRETHFDDINGLEAQGVFSGRSRTLMADFVWKWAPDGNARERGLTVQGEWFLRRERGDFACLDEEELGNACAGGVDSTYASRQHGAYAQAVWQFSPRWRAGVRFDRLDSGRRNFGSSTELLAVEDYTPQRTTLMADYRFSEFSLLRLQVARDRSQPNVTDHPVTLQYVMSLGAHGAHRY